MKELLLPGPLCSPPPEVPFEGSVEVIPGIFQEEPISSCQVWWQHTKSSRQPTSFHSMISLCSLFRWQAPSSLMLEVPPLLKSPAHHISLSSCRQSSYPLSASFKSVICIQRAIFLTALMSSQLSMVGVRVRKSSVTERRTGKTLTLSLLQGYDHHN